MSAIVKPRRFWRNVDRTQTIIPEVEPPKPKSLDAIWDAIKRKTNEKVQLQCQLARCDTDLDDLRQELVSLLVEIDKSDQIFKGTTLEARK